MANNIKSQLFSGVFYTALAKYSGVVISLVVAGILARLLSPDDFGIVAVATVIIAFFNLLTDMGVSPAIVQHKSLTKDDLSGHLLIYYMDGHRNQHPVFRFFVDHRRLLPKRHPAHPVPTAVRQPVLRLRHHCAGSHVLPEQRI